ASDGPKGLIRDGENGLLVLLPAEPGGGPAALAAAIEALCEDPVLRRRLGQAGRHAYEAEFTEAAVVARYRDFFDRVAG
ncbi:MAG: glycosyltransferase, partial [Stellaceae bacterium]